MKRKRWGRQSVCLLSNFNSLLAEFSLLPIWKCQCLENRLWKLNYCIDLEIPRIEKMLNNEKPLTP